MAQRKEKTTTKKRAEKKTIAPRKPAGKQAGSVKKRAPRRQREASPATQAPRAGREVVQSQVTPTSGAPASKITPPSSSVPFPIVGIGASAGGLAAFEAFFSAMPPMTEAGIALVLVQHLSPDHKSILTELVQRYTRMQVTQVTNGMEVKPNRAYINPPNRNITLKGGVLTLSEPTEPRGVWLPIDFFFRSLAEAHHERAICIVLSGTGSDGALGVRAIKGEGGMAMAQMPETAEHDGMPRAAINTGMVDFMLPPTQMPEQLINYVRHAFGKREGPTATTRDLDFIRKLCVLLRAQTGHDFSQYKETTLVRRVERRMALQQIETAEEYLEFSRKNVAELDALFRDLLIGVTNFFRDPDAFKILEEKVIGPMLANKPVRDPIRIWICGCSTGEEAYSIAILLQEKIEDLKKPYKVQIFATDIDRTAIEHARVGTYPVSIASDIPEARLSRFFTHNADEDTYRIQKVIRDMLVFSEQDVIKDPPFSKLDLVTCRNLLIYLNGDLQKRLLPLFHYALRPGGALFLGPSETIGENAGLFSIVDRKWKMYTRHIAPASTRTALPSFTPALRDEEPSPRHELPHASTDDRPDLRKLTEQALLEHYSHAGVLITSRGDILQIVGRTGSFLEPAAGDATMNILSMAREGLRREMTVALHKAVAQRQPVFYPGLRVKPNGSWLSVDLVIRPALGSAGGHPDYYLVILEAKGEREKAAAKDHPRDKQTRDRIAELEQELRAKEEYLQTTLEEMETTNEELKSTNEEMQSVNEELQSTNEELETSKEELQSVNEELSTVNTELQDKVTELSHLNNDMNNLLAGTGIGTLFVDHHLRISRYTPAATQVINLIPSDVGRPVEHVVPNFLDYGNLVDDIRSVLSSLAPLESEVQVKGGAWYLMRIRPYRTMDNVIEGAVITLVDISERKRAEASLRETEARFEAVVSQAYAGVAETDVQGKLLYVNDRLCDMLGHPRKELLQKRLHELVHGGDRTRYAGQFDAVVAGGPSYEFESRLERKDGQPAWMITRCSGVRDAAGKVRTVVNIAFDISDRKRLEGDLSRIDARLAGDLNAFSLLQALGNLYINEGNRQLVLDEIIDAAIAMTLADMGDFQLLEPNGALRTVSHRGFGQDWMDFWANDTARQSACALAVKLGHRVVVEDVAQSALFEGTPALDVLRRAGVQALQSTPLIDRSGRMLGVVSTHFREPHKPDQRELRMLDLLARQAADILDRADYSSRG